MATDIQSNAINTGATSNTGAAQASANGAYENPQAQLDKDSFMELLLTQLQFQDPTEPMDSEKILTQTSQLATLESAENTKKAMEELVSKMNNNMDMGSLAAIGKMASLGSDQVELPESGMAEFEMFFPTQIQTGNLVIKDQSGNVVKTVSLDEQAGRAGVLGFQWDGTSDDGTKMSEGRYSVTAEYLDSENQPQQTQFGIYPVESVRYENGQPNMKLGSSYVPMENIKEFF